MTTSFFRSVTKHSTQAVYLLAYVSLLVALASPTATAQTVETLTEEFEASGDLSVGPDGLVYVADFGSTLSGAGGPNVYRVTLDGGITVFASGFSGASGNEFDAEGNLYQSNIGGSTAVRIAPDGTQDVLATGLAVPIGITPAPDGDVYVNECGASAITRIASDGTTTRIAQGAPLSCPNGLTVGPDGHLYAVNFRDSKMLRITLPDGLVSEFAEIPGNGNGHVTTANGRFYVASFRGQRIYEVTTDGAVRAIAGTGEAGNADGPTDQATFFRPNGIAASATGDTLFVNTVTEIVDPANSSLYPNVVRMITGVLKTVGAETLPGVSRGVMLHPLYPNPARDLVQIPYELDAPSRVRIVVYDVLGRAVASVGKESLEAAGYHEASLSELALPSGLYLVQLEASSTGSDLVLATQTLSVVK